MSLKDNDFPASANFENIAAALSNEKDKKDAIKNAKAIFTFTLKNAAGKEASWYIDLKETGTVGKGVAPAGKKPTATLILTEANFADLVAGKANAQKLFMGGKLKIKGDMMKATKLEGVLKKAQSNPKL